jgi:hypothetical protein
LFASQTPGITVRATQKAALRKRAEIRRIEEVGPTREGFADATQEFYEGALMKKL